MTFLKNPLVPSVLALRLFLWAAVLLLLLGLVAVARGLKREEQALAREKAFLASVTHELRTPLAAIRLFGETLARGRGDPEEYGQLVAQQSERLEALVERVLAVTRVAEAVRLTRVQPEVIVSSAVELIRARAQRRGVTINWSVARKPCSLPEATWDADAVGRAMLNLLDNAVKHGRPGGRVEVQAAIEGKFARLSVADDGPGIVRRDRKRIFGRFQRGDEGSSGTGLGLYLVDQVALAHGGRVDLRTEKNLGSTFTLVLPLVPPSAEIGSTAGKRGSV